MAPFVHNIYTLTGVMVLFAIGGAFANNGLTAMISNASSARDQGTVLGVCSSLDSLSGIVSPPLSTGVLARYGSPYASVWSLAMSIVGLVLGLRNSLNAPVVSKDAEAPEEPLLAQAPEELV